MSTLKRLQLRSVRTLLTLVFLAAIASCTRPPAPENGPAAQPFAGERRDARDLSRDEAAGGHTLRKHVGRTDAELRDRLEHERDIAAASTWSDRASAEAAVGAAIAEQSARISRWLERTDHPNLIIDYDGDPAHPFGRTLRRGEDRAVPCSNAVVVLNWDAPNNYHVLTAYPECRP